MLFDDRTYTRRYQLPIASHDHGDNGNDPTGAVFMAHLFNMS